MGRSLHSFADVLVVPVVSFARHVPHGGPIWPDFADQTLVRHRYNGTPVDCAPDTPKEPVTHQIDQAVWGGFLDPGFGHLVAEHLSRLRWALTAWPDATYLFTAPPGTTRDQLGGWVWQVLAWVGLPAEQVQIVDAPLRVKTLHVAAQDEMLGKIAPSAAYLDLLDGFTARIAAKPSSLLYVSRAGMVAEGNGGHAGEGYLVDILRGLGVAVFDPRRADIPSQLAAYAGARHLVFAEGSAVHGRQLLGRLDQIATILMRRPKARLAEAALAPRVTSLHYHDVGTTGLTVRHRDGRARPGPSLRLYDITRLQAAFQAIGLPIGQAWNQEAYRRAAMQDIESWAQVRKIGPQALHEYRPILRQAKLLPDALRRAKYRADAISDSNAF
jgi:hypothetical protein